MTSIEESEFTRLLFIHAHLVLLKSDLVGLFHVILYRIVGEHHLSLANFTPRVKKKLS
jgi:hypothetical protein